MVSYGLNYVGTIQGRRDEMEKVPETARDIARANAGKWYSPSYGSFAEEIALKTEAVLAKGGPLVFAFDYTEDDSCHGVLEDFLTRLDEALPGLTLFVYGTGGDADGQRFRPTNRVSPPGKSTLSMMDMRTKLCNSPFDGRRDWDKHPFQGCSELTCLQFPCFYRKKWAISAGDFKGCVSLADIILPDCVTKIAKTAFKDCRNLTIHAYKDSFAEKFAEERGIALKLVRPYR